ncbi:MAG: HPF/RaiA family ribosome-associated protein [Holosporaceae bacterium]|nr:HPF/RaiA family ribosome-associated protein [Holosporaceae bacterium]
MKFSFSGRHMEIGETLTNKAKQDCIELAQKYAKEFIDVNIVMKKDNHIFTSNMDVKTKSKDAYHASNSANDPRISFDGVLQKIEQQIAKRKCSHCSNHARKMEMIELDNSFINESVTKDGTAGDNPIIAEILDDLPLLSVSDAASCLNHKIRVLVFKNVTTEAVNVVYVRDDQNIGWIDYKMKKVMT